MWRTFTIRLSVVFSSIDCQILQRDMDVEVISSHPLTVSTAIQHNSAALRKVIILGAIYKCTTHNTLLYIGVAFF